MWIPTIHKAGKSGFIRDFRFRSFVMSSYKVLRFKLALTLSLMGVGWPSTKTGGHALLNKILFLQILA